jgi:hypothetical protein
VKATLEQGGREKGESREEERRGERRERGRIILIN